MKALEKDRNRRYETANGLARGRAALPGRRAGAGRARRRRGYRLRKFVRRNRGPLAAAAAAWLAGRRWSAAAAVLAVQARANHDLCEANERGTSRQVATWPARTSTLALHGRGN